jgi:UDP-N-acetyl-D-glucosamine dehydrogenase
MFEVGSIAPLGVRGRGNRHKKAVNGSKILFLGVAYKPNINDKRESPALEIMDIPARKDCIVFHNYPHIPQVVYKL